MTVSNVEVVNVLPISPRIASGAVAGPVERTCECCSGTETEPTPHRNVMGITGADLVRCIGCGVKFYRRSFVAFGAYYNCRAARDMAEENARFGGANNRDADKVAAMQSARRSYYAGMIGILRRHVGSLARLYEVGTDFGEFLDVARDFGVANVGGCDVNERCAEIARSRGLAVEGAPFDLATVPDWLDGIAMLDMIEHTPTPRADLARARAHLRPGGGLLLKTFYDEFHATFPLNLGADAWADPAHGYFDPLGHLWHFDRMVLLALIERCGFAVKATEINERCGQITVYATAGEAR